MSDGQAAEGRERPGQESEVGRSTANEWFTTGEPSEVGPISFEECWDFPLVVLHSGKVCNLTHGRPCEPVTPPDRDTPTGGPLWREYDKMLSTIDSGNFVPIRRPGHTHHAPIPAGMAPVTPSLPPLHELADPARLATLHELASSFDRDLPLTWSRSFFKVVGVIPKDIVWMRTSSSDHFGRPFPLTDAAAELLERFDRDSVDS